MREKLDRPGLTSGFVPEKIADNLDFIAVHICPEAGELDAALETLRGFDVGRPLVIEETYVLRCGIQDLAEFLHASRPTATGWFGFLWGITTSAGPTTPLPHHHGAFYDGTRARNT